jgi:hypothetical protein
MVKFMRKILILLFVLVSLMGLEPCGGDPVNEGSDFLFEQE